MVCTVGTLAALIRAPVGRTAIARTLARSSGQPIDGFAHAHIGPGARTLPVLVSMHLGNFTLFQVERECLRKRF